MATTGRTIELARGGKNASSTENTNVEVEATDVREARRLRS